MINKFNDSMFLSVNEEITDNEDKNHDLTLNIMKNLHLSDIEYSYIFERRASHLYELARLMASKILCETGESFSEKLQATRLEIMDVYSFDFPSDLLEFYKKNALFASRILHNREKAMLINFIVEIIEKSGKYKKLRDFFPVIDSSDNIVCYVPGYLANKAYEVFSHFLTSPVFRPADNFELSCSEVYDENSKMCILPLESYDGGSLTGFLKIIKKYDLKILLTCSVHSEEGDTKFALLGRNIASICGFDTLSFSVNGTDEEMIKIQTQARYHDLEIVGIIKYPQSFADGDRVFEYTMSGKEEDILKYLIYLEIEIPKYNPVGLYKDVE